MPRRSEKMTEKELHKSKSKKRKPGKTGNESVLGNERLSDAQVLKIFTFGSIVLILLFALDLVILIISVNTGMDPSVMYGVLKDFMPLYFNFLFAFLGYFLGRMNHRD